MKKSQKSILLTGASGFAGAHMLKHLLENTEYQIFCPVTYTHGGHKNRIPSLVEAKYSHRFKLIHHDLAEEPDLERHDIGELACIINFASESHVDRSISNPLEFVSNNINLMTNLLEFTRKYVTSSRFIQVSTDEVYGALLQNTNNSEWMRPHLPSNPYSASKSAQESLAISYYKTFGIDMTIVNVTNMMGEAQNQEKFIPKVIRKLLSQECVDVDTDLNGRIGTRKYVYVGDVASAILTIGNQNRSSDSGGINDFPEKFHISGDKEFSNLQIVEYIAEILGVKPIIKISQSPRPGYDVSYELSSSKIRDLGWKSQESIRKSLENIVHWTLSHPDWLENDHNKR